jgi:hypothetical protein
VRISNRLAVLLIVLAPAAALAAPTPAPAAVPLGFVGMAPDPGIIPSSVVNREYGLMAASGVESVRLPFYWSNAQPYATRADVPAAQARNFVDVAGVPTDFRTMDGYVAVTARHHLRLLPIVLTAPRWARQFPGRDFSPPAAVAPYAAFLRALIGRYGPRGSFWRLNPRLPRQPIRDWQIWNEENGQLFWDDDDPQSLPPYRTRWLSTYPQLLRAAYSAVHAADPGARVVLGGLVGVSWTALDRLYSANPGLGRAFDVAAVHPYTALPENVVKIVRYARQVMNRHGDARKHLLATEFGWPSAAGHGLPSLGFETTEAEQARRLRKALQLFAAARGSLKLDGIYWYTWATFDKPPGVFGWAGLRRRSFAGRFTSKPGLAALRVTARALEGCGRRGVRRPGCQ